MKVIKIGIAPQAKIRRQVLVIAKGEFKAKALDPEKLAHLHAFLVAGVERSQPGAT
ncbi:hypothetical protein BH11PSE7_BH11PSE7_13620 [soil metagenome]